MNDNRHLVPIGINQKFSLITFYHIENSRFMMFSDPDSSLMHLGYSLNSSQAVFKIYTHISFQPESEST